MRGAENSEANVVSIASRLRLMVDRAHGLRELHASVPATGRSVAPPTALSRTERARARRGRGACRCPRDSPGAAPHHDADRVDRHVGSDRGAVGPGRAAVDPQPAAVAGAGDRADHRERRADHAGRRSDRSDHGAAGQQPRGVRQHWLQAGLESLTVGTAEPEVDLALYRVVGAAGAPSQTLAAALVANNVSAATLAFRVTVASETCGSPPMACGPRTRGPGSPESARPRHHATRSSLSVR